MTDRDARHRVLHVTAEYHPVVTVGDLGEAIGGLVRALRCRGWAVDVVAPDYSGVELDRQRAWPLPVPSWAGTMWARRGMLPTGDEVTLVGSESIRRPHPHIDPSTGEPWADNDARFFAFAAGAAAVAELDPPALVHGHDWQAAPVLDLVDPGPARVLSIHDLAQHGLASGTWIERIGPSAEAMRLPWCCDALVGGIRRADAVVTVSPTYRDEICASAGEGLSALLAGHGPHLFGILDGIDTTTWDPAGDPRIPHAYDSNDLSGKRRCRAALLDSIGRRTCQGPVVAVVSGLADHDDNDLALTTVGRIASADGLLIVHGAGNSDADDLPTNALDRNGGHVLTIGGYDATTAHRIIAGADIVVVAPRREPCGLTHLHALTYGTIPVATDVGGLHDTIVDADADPLGNGFLAARPDADALGDALSPAFEAHQNDARWAALQRRAMARDWGWGRSVRAYEQLYRRLIQPERRHDVA